MLNVWKRYTQFRIFQKMGLAITAVAASITLQARADDVTIYDYQFPNDNKVRFIVSKSAGQDQIIFQENGKLPKLIKSGITLNGLVHNASPENKGNGSGYRSDVKPLKRNDNTQPVTWFRTGDDVFAITRAGYLVKSPFKKWDDSYYRAFKYKDEPFVLMSFNNDDSSMKGTFLVRVRDGKSVKFSHAVSDINDVSNGETITVKDGILKVTGIQRAIDLQVFDAEANQQASSTPDVVLDASNRPIDTNKAMADLFVDLVQQARENPQDFHERIEPKALKQMVDALKSKRSLVITGAAGTGKTSAVRALAREIALGNVEGIPRTYKIYDVEMSKLASGTQMVGMIDERISMIKGAAQQGGVAIFVDEIHTMKGVGTHSENPTDITQHLKGAMEKGWLPVIGTSTEDEFTNAFGGDPAFAQRFEHLHVVAPEGEALFAAIQSMFQTKFNLTLERSLIEAAIEMSEEFSIDGAQPRKAINLLRKARAMISEGQAITLDELKKAAVEMYQIDPSIYSRSQARERLGNLKSNLDSDLQGQEAGKESVISIFKRIITGVGNPDKIKSALFYGPPGTGKTTIASVAAKHMKYRFKVIEMNKFGYTGQAIEEFRTEVYKLLLINPFHVIILDEFEKAPKFVQEAALSMLQSGKFSVTEHTSHGKSTTRDVTAKKAVFLITTNAAGRSGGKLDDDALREALVSGGVSEPIVSRLERLIYMGNPEQEQFFNAIMKELAATLKRESQKNKTEIRMENEFDFLEAMMMEHYTPASDYRAVGKIMSKHIEESIADALLDETFQEERGVVLTWKANKIVTQEAPQISLPLEGVETTDRQGAYVKGQGGRVGYSCVDVLTGKK